MSTLTIRRLDAHTHAKLRHRAAENGRSVEAEVRAILDAAVDRPSTNILAALRDASWPQHGIDLEVPARTDQPRDVLL